jgi:hypothetical protein
MLEPLTGRQRGDSRAILVAYDISDTMLQRCADYAVECFIIDRPTVERWRAGEA